MSPQYLQEQLPGGNVYLGLTISEDQSMASQLHCSGPELRQNLMVKESCQLMAAEKQREVVCTRSWEWDIIPRDTPKLPTSSSQASPDDSYHPGPGVTRSIQIINPSNRLIHWWRYSLHNLTVSSLNILASLPNTSPTQSITEKMKIQACTHLMAQIAILNWLSSSVLDQHASFCKVVINLCLFTRLYPYCEKTEAIE